MGLRWLTRLAGTVLAATIGVAAAAPAWAVGTIPINPGNVPTTAADFPTHECSANLGGGPFPGQDVWVFVLPQPNQHGQFTALHLTFTTPNGVETRDIPADQPSAIVNDMGTSKAWIRTPAGWTLTGGTADITGTPDANSRFNLTQTCPASSTTSPTASPTASPSKSKLPLTGSSFGDQSFVVPVALGSALLLSGVALVLMRWRRDAEARG